VTVSKQADALRQRAAELKSSADQAVHETGEQIKARIEKANADIAARQGAINARPGRPPITRKVSGIR
jgi:hypothetical protein